MGSDGGGKGGTDGWMEGFSCMQFALLFFLLCVVPLEFYLVGGGDTACLYARGTTKNKSSSRVCLSADLNQMCSENS